MCHNIIAFHCILITMMVKTASKENNTTQARLGNVAKAGMTGKKRPASLKKITDPISNKQKKSQGYISLVMLLPLMTTTLILLLTKMMMIMLSLLVFQIIPFYLRKHCKVTFLTMMTTKKMMTTTTMMTIILEWSIMLLL